MMLTDKYTPSSIKEVIGNRIQLLNFGKTISKKGRAMIHGPSGTGKTSCVFAIANDLNYEVIEINASQLRNKEQIDSVIGQTVKQKSLLHKGKIILIDDLDALNNRDRGGLLALNKILKESYFTVVLTVSNPWDKKFKDIRKLTELIEFKRLDYNDILTRINYISKKEKLKISQDNLKKIAINANGDLRAAINDLHISDENIEFLEKRKIDENVFNTLKTIFKTNDIKSVLNCLDNLKMDLNEFYLWLDENIPLEYKKKEELIKAYDCLSKADIFQKRIRKTQNYRYLVYINTFLTAGIANAKVNNNQSFTKYKRMSRILKLWRINLINKKRNEIALNIANKLHLSKKRTIKEMPYIKTILKTNKQVVEELKINQEDLDYL